MRGKRFIAVIECILNQNARDAGAARSPAMNFEVLQLCHEHRIGVLQIPCPEIAALGCRRSRPPGQTIRQALDTEAGRRCCEELASTIADRIEAYLAEDYLPVAILGGNPRSPGCAVHHDHAGISGDSGIFMQALAAELERRNIKIPFQGIRDHNPEWLAQDMRWLQEQLTRLQQTEPRT